MSDDRREQQPKEEGGWLQRQWRRLRTGRWRDVIIAQVDEGASNVAVGKNIFQLNVGGRNITPYVVVIMLAVLAIGAYFAYPHLVPLWNPAQMEGQFNIAIAEFGELDEQGKVQATVASRTLSTWLYEQLATVYAETPDVPLTDSVEIWHNSRLDTERNVALRAIRGQTSDARTANAAKLAERIGAHMIIYGYLTDGGDTSGLDLEFYLSPRVNDETAAIVGPHELGSPIAVPIPFDADDPIINVTVGERLRTRTEALFWLTAGLTQQILGRTEAALTTLRRGEAVLDEREGDEGRAILYFFIGREELFLGNDRAAEEAFRAALELDGDYARAHNGLGSVHFWRAQAVPPAERLTEPAELRRAQAEYVTALELARAQENALVEHLALLSLGMTARLEGESAYVQQDFAPALAAFDRAQAYLNQALAYFSASTQYRLTAQAYESLGLAHFQRADILRQQQDGDGRQVALEAARDAFAQCEAQADAGGFDALLRDRIIQGSCLPFREAVEAALADIEKESS